MITVQILLTINQTSDFVAPLFRRTQCVAEVPVIPSAKASDAIPPKSAAPMCDRRGRDGPRTTEVHCSENVCLDRGSGSVPSADMTNLCQLFFSMSG